MSTGIITRSDGVSVCPWSEGDHDYMRYHDTEWGVPVTDDIKLYEKMCLEGFQSGLSWLTILRKRENFRAAFAGFNFEKVAKFGGKDLERLLADAGIVRHRGKIEATISNARAALETIERHGSLARFFWDFEPSERQSLRQMTHVPAKTLESEQMSKALKQLGWRFVGPTTCYSLMQADGIVNDHLVGCFRYGEIEVARKVAKKSI
ncbi:MAG: DNA-3-methyladenine glycosylase I [Acidimicrobiales bacterium]|jgi:DNA-3-methyladenine glycosylase I|nr:DNA-3-methyladenine glycosylase I [Acidimicrobiales bacterium]